MGLTLAEVISVVLKEQNVTHKQDTKNININDNVFGE